MDAVQGGEEPRQPACRINSRAVPPGALLLGALWGMWAWCIGWGLGWHLLPTGWCDIAAASPVSQTASQGEEGPDRR